MAEHATHSTAIATELDWLARVIEARLTHFFDGEAAPFDVPTPPDQTADSALGALIAQGPLDTPSRLILALAVAAQVNSAILDPFFVKNSALDRVFSQFGGDGTDRGNGFRPTAETALFLVAGADTAQRIAAMALFDPDQPLRRRAGLTLGGEAGRAPGFGAGLHLPLHRVVSLCEGAPPRPDFSPGFPARRLTTRLDWDDLVLPREVRHGLDQVLAWLTHRDRILTEWGLGRQFGPGFKALFHGPPGTGKSLTAALIGKRMGLDVYRIDLSMVVSKYIGETEKNLAQVFDLADERDWILFFDEADALFGARGATSTANDRYANQEVSYLLQRIEDSQSLVILATNLRGNIDDAFFRRFQAAIGFRRPNPQERRALWAGVLRDMPLARDATPDALATVQELSGAAIANVARAAAISALRRGAGDVAMDDFRQAIAAEMRKEGRTA